MSGTAFHDGRVVLHQGDSRLVLKTLADNSIDSAVMDPPYALVSITKRFGKPGSAAAQHGRDGLYARASAGFMGKQWDTGETAFDPAFWAEVLRVLKPGAHLVAFGGTRTYHRLACAIEDAGFDVRDTIMWHYGSGFPKSHDVSKGIDNAAGAERASIGKERNFGKPKLADGKTPFGDYAGEWDITAPSTDAARQWQGWGTALKPATEIIALARKPLSEGTVAANVLRWGTAALNIDGTRIGTRIGTRTASTGEIIGENVAMSGPNYGRVETGETTIGRWPANICHDGSDEVMAAFPDSNGSGAARILKRGVRGVDEGWGLADLPGALRDAGRGTAARFFYSSKADADDRLASKHPTVKPVDLMQWLVRLVTPVGGLVLDAFAGSGTTGEAAFREGMRAVLIEREAEYCADIERRMGLVLGGPDERRRAIIKQKTKDQPADPGPLFGGSGNIAGGGQTDLREVCGPIAELSGRSG